MNVLVVTSEFPSSLEPHRASFNRQHLSALAEYHRVAIFCPLSWRTAWRHFSARATAPDTLPAELEVDYAPYFYPPGIMRGSYDKWMWHSICRPLLQFARRCDPDIILGVWGFPDGAVAVRLGERLGVPVVLQVLGSDINLLDAFPARKRRTLETLAKADRVLAVSEALRDSLVNMGVDPGKVAVVYRGVNAELFAARDNRRAKRDLGLDDGRKHFLFIGNLVEVKNPRLLLRAFAAARFSRESVLHMIGDGPLRAELEGIAHQLGSDKEVCFHGVVPHLAVPGWMSAADCLVLSSEAEGVPNVLLEARTMGCPYIATAVGGVAEVSAHSGATLVPAGDELRMAEALQAAVAGPLLRMAVPWQSWSEAGAKLAAELTRLVPSAGDDFGGADVLSAP